MSDRKLLFLMNAAQAEAFAAEHNGTTGSLENIQSQLSMVKKP